VLLLQCSWTVIKRNTVLQARVKAPAKGKRFKLASALRSLA
jgi:hypothetical protein